MLLVVLATGALPLIFALGARKPPRSSTGGNGRAPMLVAGRFVLAQGSSHTSPDGDTVRFVPDRAESLCSRRPCPNGVNVRLASIDALELHYDCGHQHVELAQKARDRLLELLGFASVTYHTTPGGIPEVVRSVPAQVRGYIVAFGRDTTGKRAAGYVFPGEPPASDGSPVELTGLLVRNSINWRLLSEGLAYPAYFADSVNSGVLPALDDAVKASRTHASGVWRAMAAETSGGVDVLWPPVARSQCAWARRREGGTLDAYLRWLRGADSVPSYPYLQRTTGRRVRLGDVVTLESGRLALTVRPEELIAQP
jgi:endonuclease YncB( thermonuclease family)